MAERLTMTSDKGGVAFTFDLDITCRPSEAQKILKLAEKLKHYEDLEEAGRLIIVPESFNVKTAVECITEKFCPSTFGLNNYTERCGHDDCKGCWEAALKGAENDNL